jgi:hypothetical protein
LYTLKKDFIFERAENAGKGGLLDFLTEVKLPGLATREAK